MKSFNDRQGVRLFLLGLVLALPSCGGSSSLASAPARPESNGLVANGPAADYPIVIGAPFTVDGVVYTPADTLNYDEVGLVTLDPGSGAWVTGAHRSLPLPSYVEVTSLESGRTILVRLTKRGPMSGSSLIGLSPGAAEQLGITAGTPVRVRRVNPPEQERAMLRGGGRAPERMETPMSLVTVLLRKLPGEAPLAPAAALPPLEPMVAASTTPQAVPLIVKRPEPVARPTVTSAPADGFVVQAGAFSTRDRADLVASVVGGQVSKSGSLYRVRTGPFTTRKEAEASLAKVRAAGYSDARIYSGG